MKKTLNKKFLIIITDILVIPILIICEKLTDYMLMFDKACPWTVFGGKCVTCGGTHFVNSILNGRIVEAIEHNIFLFVMLIVLVVSFILINLYWIFNIDFARKILLKIYSISSLIIAVIFMLTFFFIRNIPVFQSIIEHISLI